MHLPPASTRWNRVEGGGGAHAGPLLIVFIRLTAQLGTYRIYLINHPGRLFNFGPIRVGAYSRWVLIRGWALIIFPTFSASEDTFRE